jgi:hypothetical protein
MTRIDMTTRELHALLAPVLPHASKDKDSPARCVVRLDHTGRVLYAVAGDGYTLAAERWKLPSGHDRESMIWDWDAPVHVRATDVAAVLKLFTYDKDADPPLKVTIDKAPVPIRVAGSPAVINHQAVTIESDDGTRLVLHDQRDPSHDPLASWRRSLWSLWNRPLATLPALALSAAQMAKWGASVGKGERVTIYSGAEGAPLLILVGHHFAGAWVQVRYLDGPEKALAESPWLGELAADRADRFDTETGELRDPVVQRHMDRVAKLTDDPGDKPGGDDD